MDLTGLGSVFDFAKGVLERVFPDPAQRAQAALELEKLHQSGELQKMAMETDLLKAQTDINKIEAASTSMFIAGWRPCCGWIGAAGLGYAAIFEPLARFIAEVVFGYKLGFPTLDTTITMQILVGILGLGAYRSAEKIKGTEGNR